MKNFKVLMSNGIIERSSFFVDEKHLGRGIYEAAVPMLRPMTDTMDSIVQKLVASPVRHESTDAVLRNLSLCRLEEVEVLIPESVPAEKLTSEELALGVIIATTETEENVSRETSPPNYSEEDEAAIKGWNPDMPLEELHLSGDRAKSEEE